MQSYLDGFLLISIFFIVIGLRALLRRDWIVAIIGALLFTIINTDALNSTKVLVEVGIYLVVYGLIIFSLLRFGLVVTISMVFFLGIANSITLGSDWSTWAAPYGIATMSVLLGLALLAFRKSLGNRDLIGGEERSTALRQVRA